MPKREVYHTQGCLKERYTTPRGYPKEGDIHPGDTRKREIYTQGGIRRFIPGFGR